MPAYHEIWYIKPSRATKAHLKKLAIYSAILLTVIMCSRKTVHVDDDDNGVVHLGIGAEHGEQRGSRMGGWRERLKGPLNGDDPRVVTELRVRHLQQPSTKPYNLNTYVNRLDYKDLDSWKFLHDRVIQLFGKQPPGFFIEAGALDGEYLSNTLHLEKEKHMYNTNRDPTLKLFDTYNRSKVYGWHGLLVEANPVAYKHLLKKNRKAWSSNTCLAISPFPQEMVLEVVDTHARTDTASALWVIRGSSFLTEAGGRDQRYQANHYDTTYASVQCFPITTYIKALNITKIDLFSLDVEGAEQKILKTIPWSSVDISVLLVEHHGDVKGKDVSFVQNIQDKGYNLYDYLIDKDNIGDYVFVKKGFLK